MTDGKSTSLFELAGKHVYVAGHKGMVGAALVRRLRSESCMILTVDHAALDLTRQAETEQWIGNAKPDAVVLAAAKVGGIAFNNSHPVDFLSDNLAIAHNVISASYAALPRLLLHLSQISPAADGRGHAAYRTTRADQSMVRGGQNRGH